MAKKCRKIPLWKVVPTLSVADSILPTRIDSWWSWRELTLLLALPEVRHRRREEELRPSGGALRELILECFGALFRIPEGKELKYHLFHKGFCN